MLAAPELGLRPHSRSIEDNICYGLLSLGRAAEAGRRLQALLAEIDGDDGDHNPSLPWVLGALLESQVALCRRDAAQALAPRALAADQRGGSSARWLGLLQLVTAQRRAQAALGAPQLLALAAEGRGLDAAAARRVVREELG